MKSLVSQLRSAEPVSVLIIGDVMLDEYLFGAVTRISPEAPILVVKEERREQCLGGAANVAANCKHIGMLVDIIGFVNEEDASGQAVQQLLKDMRINTSGLIHSSSRKTTCKQRIMSGHQQCLRVDSETERSMTEHEEQLVMERIDRLLKPNSVVMISDYSKGVLDETIIEYVIKKAHAVGSLVIADPKGPFFSKYRGVDYLKPNLTAFNQMIMYCGLSLQVNFVENARSIIKKLEIKGLVVTKGDQGIHFISLTEDVYSPAYKREVFDLSGAGDTAFAFLALSLAHKLAMVDALMLANRAASVAVSHLKTYAVSLEELIDCESEPDAKIIYDWAKLKMELDWLRIDGKKVVFTNGCYDLLHVGHTYLLREAKKQGDILVVALNSDDSVKRLNKGPERPINTLDDRAQVIASLGVVDFVVSFDQDTPQSLIEYLRPDVHVKGGDYKAESLPEYKTIIAYGGTVHIVNLVPEKSTTSIVNRFKGQER